MVYHADYTNAKHDSKIEALEHILISYELLKTDNWVSNLLNCSSLLWHGYHSLGVEVNWTGFYINQQFMVPSSSSSSSSSFSSIDELILAPFQGKVACQTISFGKGVCGTAALTQTTQVVSDVEKFPGHIACDGETKSEIVVPILQKRADSKVDGKPKVIGVIDLDCLQLNGFDEVDKEYLEKLADLISESFN